MAVMAEHPVTLRNGAYNLENLLAVKGASSGPLQAVEAGPAVVVFGKDEEDKARAARFRSEEAEQRQRDADAEMARLS